MKKLNQQNVTCPGVCTEEAVLQGAKVINKVDLAEAETTCVEPISEAEKAVSENKVLHLTLDGKKLAEANSLQAVLEKAIQNYAGSKTSMNRNCDDYDIIQGDVELFSDGNNPYDSVSLERQVYLNFKKNGSYAQGVKVTVKVEVNNF